MTPAEDPPPSIAELTQAAIGGNDFRVPPPTYEQVRRRSLLVPSLVLGLVLTVAVSGFVVHLREQRLFRSTDPTVAFSEPTTSDSARVAPIRDLLMTPGARGSLRVAHVTYSPPGSGMEVPGMAVELKDKGFDGELGLLPFDHTERSEPLLGRRTVVTIEADGLWSQIVATPGRLFFASGESTEQTLAVLRAMLEDEGLDVPPPPGRTDA